VAAESQAKLIVAHVIPTPGEGAAQDRAVKSAEETVRGVERELGVSAEAEIAEVEILDGSPASALSEAAERLDADLMVIGRTRCGASAYAIIAHSPCPVLSV
jgi:c(7)-type cytochrome triheme protein